MVPSQQEMSVKERQLGFQTIETMHTNYLKIPEKPHAGGRVGGTSLLGREFKQF